MARLWAQIVGWVRKLNSFQISVHAAHTCYFFVLSAFPALVLMLGLLRYTSFRPQDLMELAAGILPSALYEFVWQILSGTYAHTSRVVISMSALTALWSASRGIYGLQKGLDAVYGTARKRSWLGTRLMCALYTVLFLLVLILTLVLHVFGNTILQFLRHTGSYGILALTEFLDLRFVLLVTVQTLLFCAMFMYLPGRNGFWESLPGALFGAFGWMAASTAFSVYVRYFPRYANIYGSVYAVALNMLWLYLCVSIVFYGGVLNRILKNGGKM